MIDKEELKTLLETPLDPNLDYYDATASIEAMAKHIEGLHKLINVMFESLATQGASLIRLHHKSIELEGDMAKAGIGTKSGLIGIPRPKLDS
jgi:hypothetical protein